MRNMEYQNKTNGLQTFLEHSSFLVTALIAVVASVILTFFSSLSGMPWIYFFVAGMILLVLGAALIVWAKLPAYRSGRFLTFGIKSVPQNLAKCYRWGWRVFLFGVALSLCLMLSKQ